MEKEDAIKQIERVLRYGYWTYRTTEAFKMAIEAIKNQGCGCSICLIHNDMKCPLMKEGEK